MKWATNKNKVAEKEQTRQPPSCEVYTDAFYKKCSKKILRKMLWKEAEKELLQSPLLGLVESRERKSWDMIQVQQFSDEVVVYSSVPIHFMRRAAP